LSRRERALSNRSYPWTDLDPERRNALLLIGGIGLVVLVAIAFIAYGYYTDRIAPNRETVLEVGDRKFNYAFFERRAVAELNDGRISAADANSLSAGILNTMSQIEREEALRVTAERLNIEVTEADIEASMRDRLLLQDDVTREIFASRLRSELLLLGLSLGEYRDIARATAIEDKLRTQVTAIIPAEAEHADLRLIQAETQEKANEARQRLANGDPFADVASAISIHSSKSRGGEVGWTPRGALLPDLEAAVFRGVGVSDVISTNNTFFIIETRGLEVRTVSDDGKEDILETQVGQILRQSLDEAGASRTLTIGQVQRLSAKLFNLRDTP
jgi:hypothetical protein